MHRPENTDDPRRLKGIITALEEIAARVPIILPLHPRTRKRLNEIGLYMKQVVCIEPVGYFDMICLLGNCRAVFTDSGGVQKEAYFFHKPCITLRNETEWVELVEHGYNSLVGADKEKILSTEQNLANFQTNHWIPLYGNGDAGQRIVNILLNLH